MRINELIGKSTYWLKFCMSWIIRNAHEEKKNLCDENSAGNKMI